MEDKSLFDNVGLLSATSSVAENIKDFGTDNGVYVEAVELQNWGPFSFISECFLQGFPTLLVGENGTGKSSLMDAILTLLIPQKELHYNSASDNRSNKADERTLMEYVLGVSGSHYAEDESGLTKKTKYLRETGEISIILMRFRTGTDFLTIANIFLAEEGKKDPQRFYIFAKKPLSIKSDFIFTGIREFKDIKSVLKAKKCITVTTDRTQYFQFVRAEVGLVDNNAMRLLNSLSSMKSLPKPDEFIRSHMLPGRTDYKSSFYEMKQSMEEVREIGERLRSARKRHSMLASLLPYLNNVKKLQKEYSLWSLLNEKVRPYVYRIGQDVADKEVALLKEKKSVLSNKISTLEKRKNDAIELKANLVFNRDNAGGGAIAQKTMEMENLRTELANRQKALLDFSNAVNPLGFSTANLNEYSFTDIYKQIDSKRRSINAIYQERLDACKDADTFAKAKGDEFRALERDKRRLEEEGFVIDEGLVAIRNEICKALDIDTEDMPFLGSFLSVKESEKEWRPALEHLMYQKSVSFLVPEKYLTKVTNYLKTHKSSGRMIQFLAMKPVEKHQNGKYSKATPPAWTKIDVKKGKPYTAWIEEYLKSFAVNYCCETSEEFASYFPAIMKDGQIRSNRYVHTKNERINIFDSKNFVMSGSYEDKKKALEEASSEKEKEFNAARSAFAKATVAVRSVESEKELLEKIPYVSSFSTIDVKGIESAIESCQEAIDALSSSKKLQNYETKIKEADFKINTLSDDISKLRLEMEGLQSSLGSITSQIENYKSLLNECSFNEEEEKVLSDLYKKYAPESLNPKFDSIIATASKIISQITKQVGTIMEEKTKETREVESRMRAYLDEFKSRRADLSPSIEFVDGFINEYHSVADENLPEAIKAYENVKDFGKLDALRNFVAIMTVGIENEIQKAVNDVNTALRKVPYSQGTDPTFLQVNCLQNRAGDVVYLRQILRDLASSKSLSIIGNTSAEEADKTLTAADELISFIEPRVSRIRKDTYSQDNILDPRNWYIFPVSVCREEVMSNGEIAIVHVKELDKTNKQSSGEGEKFTYFILAACFAIWMHLLDEDYTGRTFRFLMIDEVGNKLTQSNLRDVISLFNYLKIQLVSILPLGDKVSEYEGFVGNIIQTDWYDKAKGISFVDTISLLDYAKRNKEIIESSIRKGKEAYQKSTSLEEEIIYKTLGTENE